MARELYYFTNEQWALNDIALKHLKVSYIDSLNDPFELIGYRANPQKLKDPFKEMVSGKFGIICFSQSFESPLMWAHYADNHKGVCLKFDVPEDDCLDVIYSKSMEKFIEEKLKDRSLAFKLAVLCNCGLTFKDLVKILTTKFSEWSYEKETRILIPLNDKEELDDGLQYENFGERLQLKQVILGINNQINRVKLQDFLERNYQEKVEIYNAEASPNEFKVVIVKYEPDIQQNP
ncbi:MAG: hypothetical protein RLZZ66_514 [Pseudomonadota bacterium]|jgi:hypothetical protein